MSIRILNVSILGARNENVILGACASRQQAPSLPHCKGACSCATDRMLFAASSASAAGVILITTNLLVGVFERSATLSIGTSTLPSGK